MFREKKCFFQEYFEMIYCDLLCSCRCRESSVRICASPLSLTLTFLRTPDVNISALLWRVIQQWCVICFLSILRFIMNSMPSRSRVGGKQNKLTRWLRSKNCQSVSSSLTKFFQLHFVLCCKWIFSLLDRQLVSTKRALSFSFEWWFTRSEEISNYW